MLTLIFLGLYLVPVYLIQPKLALANYETMTGSSKKKANEKAFWQSILWPAMLVMLRGHKVIEEKKSTELALAEARRVIATDNVRTNPAMAEWDRNAGITSGRAVLDGTIMETRDEVTFADLRFSDKGRKIRVRGSYETMEGTLMYMQYRDGIHNVVVNGTTVFCKLKTKITFLD